MSQVAAEDIVQLATSIDFNEADTRFQIIDRLLREVLGWPTQAFRMEQSTLEGFADYHLLRPNGKPALIVEAKRTGVYFDLPANFNHKKPFRAVKTRTLLTAEALKRAIIQAQRYCADEGCEYGAVTNGAQFVLFKAFQRGKAWRDLTALVVSDIVWFATNYTEAVRLLGYSSVIERQSLLEAFEGNNPDSREVFFPKERIVSFNQTINANALARHIRGIVQRYFGPIDVEDPEFVDKCYVFERAHDKNVRGIRTLIRDSVSPFMETYGVADTEDAESGGVFANRLAKAVRKEDKGDVVILFGGKGSGKSTFIKKVLMYKPPQYLKKHSTPVIIDLLSAPKDPRSVREHLWRALITKLDTEQLLVADRDALIRLFDDRFQVAKRQELTGLFEDSEAYNLKLNALLAAWKADEKYVAARLVMWHKKHHRGAIIAVDNTDQLENELQDYAFSLAAEISEELGCVVLITMREERFYASKIRGMLDAYQNSAFHISSPTPDEVFSRRIQYVLELIAKSSIEIEEGFLEDVLAFFRVFRADFQRDPPSPLNQFVTASAHGNIRLALDLFGDLILSGYTNATEMAQSRSGWVILIHQVIKPLLTPTRLFYDEKLSKIPNLFQIRTSEGGSHFTGLRILKRLSIAQDPLSPSFVSMTDLRGFFSETFGADADFRHWIDRLLASNLVEASTRHDAFSEDIDALKITSFGQFALTDLYKAFTYCDLVCTDCGMRSESHANGLVTIANTEVQLFNERRRFERVKLRLEKMDLFVSYLAQEEDREVAYFSLGSEYEFVSDLVKSWEIEKPRVLQSASRNK
ncbi:hypothetical protein [Paracidovorax oryzae]|uniref:hypothetical protein n=1 Tax=Paracidovorax oryzae TaxID=862720 RepID=UPI0012EBCAE2|nr:hypothetical protein [Paracidovorax oryzae]